MTGVVEGSVKKQSRPSKQRKPIFWFILIILNIKKKLAAIFKRNQIRSFSKFESESLIYKFNELTISCHTL